MHGVRWERGGGAFWNLDGFHRVEEAWRTVAHEICADPAFVNPATHGKRDDRQPRLRGKPYHGVHELAAAAVDEFERSILLSISTPIRSCAPPRGGQLYALAPVRFPAGSGHSSCVSLLFQSAAASTEQLVVVSGPQVELGAALSAAAVEGRATSREGESVRGWELEAVAVDRSVRVLPGVKAQELSASILEGRWYIQRRAHHDGILNMIMIVALLQPALHDDTVLYNYLSLIWYTW